MLHEHFRWQNMLRDFVKRIYAHTHNIPSPLVNKLRLHTVLQITPEIPPAPKIAPKQSSNPFFSIHSFLQQQHSTIQPNFYKLLSHTHDSIRSPLRHSLLLPEEQQEPAVGISSRGFLPHPESKLFLCQNSVFKRISVQSL